MSSRRERAGSATSSFSRERFEMMNWLFVLMCVVCYEVIMWSVVYYFFLIYGVVY